MPILAILLVIGLYYVARETIKDTGRAVGRARARSRAAATSRGGHASHSAIPRRAARQATAGWWSNEILHGFPHLRHGLSAGWDEHRAHLRELERTRMQRRAQHATRWAQVQADIDAYLEQWRKAIERAAKARAAQQAQQAQQAGPLMAPPPPAGWTCSRCGSHYVREAQPADGICATCRLNENTSVTQPPASQAGAGNGKDTPVAGGDINYDRVLELTQQIQQDAEEGLNSKALDEAAQLIDGLGSMIPGDSTTLGIAGDLASAIAKAKEDMQEILDQAQSLRTRVEKTYGPVQEARDASGEELPQPEFAEH